MQRLEKVMHGKLLGLFNWLMHSL